MVFNYLIFNYTWSQYVIFHKEVKDVRLIMQDSELMEE